MSDTKKVHEGRNVKRFREIMGIKQEAFLRHEVAHFDSEFYSVS